EGIARRRRTTVLAPTRLPAAAVATTAEVAPILRGATAIAGPSGSGAYKRFILEFRSDPAVLAYVNGAELQRYGQAAGATPHQPSQTPPRWSSRPPTREGSRSSRGGGGGASFGLSRTTMPFLPATMHGRRCQGASSTRCRGSFWCRGSACSGSDVVPETRGS